MSVRTRLDGLFDLGPRDDPRAIAVASHRRRVATPVVSTPGARLRLVRTGEDGELTRLLLWCVRNGVPVEITTGAHDEVWLEGTKTEPRLARRALTVR